MKVDRFTLVREDPDTGIQCTFIMVRSDGYPDGRPETRWLPIFEFRAFTGLRQGQIEDRRENDRSNRSTSVSSSQKRRSFRSLKKGYGPKAVFDSWGYLDLVLADADDREAIDRARAKEALARAKARRKAEREEALETAVTNGVPKEIPLAIDIDEDSIGPVCSEHYESYRRTYHSNSFVSRAARTASFIKRY